MDQSDRDTIQRNIKPLSKLMNVDQLAENLISKGVINHDFVERIKASYHTSSDRNLEFFLRYTKKGPEAFRILITALEEVGNFAEARLLAGNEGTTVNIRSRPNRGRGASVSSEESEESLSSGELAAGTGIGEGAFGESSGSSESATSSISSSSNTRMGNSSPVGLGALRVSDANNLRGVIRSSIRKSTSYNMGKLDTKEAYQMMSKPRGFALIINNQTFPNDPTSTRIGSAVDVLNLYYLFLDLGFEVMIREDVTRDDLIRPTGILKEFSDHFSSNKDVDCCVVAVMSHGIEDQIRTCDPGHVYVNLFTDIIQPFNNRHCPSLIDKPKIFIVQSCRGDERDRGVLRAQADGRAVDVEPPRPSPKRETVDASRPNVVLIPSHEDIIICYPTVPGYVANRDPEQGTWYIKCLVECFRKYSHELELLAILRKVSQKLGTIKSENGEKQMCTFNNIGFRELYFNPGLFMSDENT